MAELRVLMIISSFYPVIGGAEKQAFLLARALREFGVEVTILTRRFPGKPYKENFQGIEVVRAGVHQRNKVGSILSTMGWFAFCWKHRSEFDLFHAHQPFSSALVAGLVSKLRGKSTIVKIPGIRSADISWWRGELLTRTIDAVVVTNKESKVKAARHFPQEKIYLIPNGIDFQERTLRRPQTSDEKTVLAVSRLAPGKGIDILIKAWPKVASTLPGAHLVIVGSGPMKSELIALARQMGVSNSIQFTGRVDPFKVETWYRQAACFVQPSLNEGISNSLLEAIISGVPVVATRIPGNIDVITSEEMGLLCEPGDSDALSEAILVTLRDRDKAQQRVQQAYEYVRDNFDIRKVAQRYIALYRQLIGGASA